MSKKIYLVRHCEAEGQPAEARLTEKGYKQAADLSEFFSDIQVDRIISSPFLRAVETIKPLARGRNLMVERDLRLAERVLSSEQLPDWLEKLEAAFIDLDLAFKGGESSREAMERGAVVVQEVLESELEHTVLVSHGNLMTLLIKFFSEVWF